MDIRISERPIAMAIMAAFGLSTAAADGVPLDGLVGSSEAQGRALLGEQGYQWVSSKVSRGRDLGHWWNAEQGSCVTVVLQDGLYDALRASSPETCDQAGKAQRFPHEFDDLVGARAASVNMRMDRDGFREVDRYEGANVMSTWWHNARTAECVKVDVVQERVEKVSRAPGYPACKA